MLAATNTGNVQIWHKFLVAAVMMVFHSVDVLFGRERINEINALHCMFLLEAMLLSGAKLYSPQVSILEVQTRLLSSQSSHDAACSLFRLLE